MTITNDINQGNLKDINDDVVNGIAENFLKHKKINELVTTKYTVKKYQNDRKSIAREFKHPKTAPQNLFFSFITMK